MSRTRKQKKRWNDDFEYDYEDEPRYKNKSYDRRKEKKIKQAIKTRNFNYFEEEQE